MQNPQRTVPNIGPSENIQPGQNLSYDRGWCDLEGPKGMRNIIERLTILTTADLDAVTTGAIQGEDSAGFLRQLEVKDSAGHRINHSGQELRTLEYYVYGGDKKVPAEPADQAAATDVEMDYRHEVPFDLPFMVRGEDFGLPVDHFRKPNFVLKLHAASNSDVPISAGSMTLNTTNGVTMQVIAWTYEELHYETKARWISEVQATKSDDRFGIEGVAKLPILGLWLHKDGSASGGADLANIDTVEAPKLGLEAGTEDERLEQGYLFDRTVDGTLNAKDPFSHTTADPAEEKAFPLIWAKREQRMARCHSVGATPEVKLTGTTIADKNYITMVATPPSARDERWSADARKVDLGAARPKTASGKSIDPNDPVTIFLPKKVGKGVEAARAKAFNEG